ncbi:MAG: hypothetical protein CVU91_02300 [Firmicutes bacterium HGW-Firmicutes-16]|nr:MAG: hypothetical protein CVU91_02300 [Firmicutes bacterium HGW-Firmicutes-16]
MASNFTSLWTMSFSWLGTLLNMKLPIYLSGVSLSTMDIIIGTIGIFVAIASIRSLVKATLSIAGKDIQSARSGGGQYKRVDSRISSSTSIEHQQMLEAVHRSQGGKK